MEKKSYIKDIKVKSISRELMPVCEYGEDVDYLPEREIKIKYVVTFINGEAIELEKSYYPDEPPTFEDAEKWLREYWRCE